MITLALALAEEGMSTLHGGVGGEGSPSHAGVVCSHLR
jgi:hypothetical protein